MKTWIGILVSTLIGAVPAWAEAESNAPDAMKHMVVAPDIDFANLRDPFASYLAKVKNAPSPLVDNKRMISSHDHEKLEDFDLGTLSLVAIFSMGGERVAMVQDATAKGYIVRRGNFMGKNNGKIEKITDDTIFLVEQVLNPAGEVIDRQVTLTMKEVNE